MDDEQIVNEDNKNNEEFDPDNPESYQDIDQMMEDVTGNVPQPGKSYSIAEEVETDEEDR